MIRATLEILPATGGPIKNVGRVEIFNVVEEISPDVGNYAVIIYKPGSDQVWKTGEVRGFLRQKLSPYELLQRALQVCFEEG